MKQIQMSLLASTIVLFTGCGGGGSSTPETATGQFVDTYVAGLNYTCTTAAAGITDNEGYYTCNVGDTVTFSLGEYILGSATASSGIITPADIQPDNADAALNVAQLLQSFDTDPTDDIISIDVNFTALDDVNVTLDDPLFDDKIVDEIDVPLVTEDDAQTHLQEAELITLLGGNVFYQVGEDWEVGPYVDRWTISDFTDNTASVLWEEIYNQLIDATGTDGLRISTDQALVTTLIFTPDETGDGVFELLYDKDKSTDEYLYFASINSDDELKLYFEEADAKAVYDSLIEPSTSTAIPITQAVLDGKTFYNYDYDQEFDEDIYGKITFINGTATRTEINNGGQPETSTFDYVIVDGKIKVTIPEFIGETETDPAEYIYLTLLSEHASTATDPAYWVLKDEEDVGQDGSIDNTNEMTLWLAPPADFPDFGTL